MSGIINFIIGFISSAVVTLAIIYVFNRFTVGGVAALGKQPIMQTVGGATK